MTLTKQEVTAQSSAVFAMLKTLHPVFNYDQPKPLTIGITYTLIATYPHIDVEVWGALMNWYCRSPRYLKSFEDHDARYNLDNLPAQTISEGERIYARNSYNGRYTIKAIRGQVNDLQGKLWIVTYNGYFYYDYYKEPLRRKLQNAGCKKRIVFVTA